MAYKRIIDPDLPITHTACVYLRSKQMYVTGQVDPDHPDEDGREHYCWCINTQHILGPDDNPVGRAECSPERECYRDSR